MVNILITLFNLWRSYWGKIKIEREATRIKDEINRKYFHFEVSAKNLLEIYPKLNRLMLESVYLAGPFGALNKQIKESHEKHKINEDWKTYIYLCFESILKDSFFGFKEHIIPFDSFIKSNILFISKKVYKLARNFIMKNKELYELMKEEIAYRESTEYKYEDLINLLDRANAILKDLEEKREELQNQMREELNHNYLENNKEEKT